MRHYVARQRQKDLRWDFTCNDYPTGYCAEHDGHETKEQACECYKKYLLDHHLILNRKSSSMNRCKVCKEYTNLFAMLSDYRIWFLCEKHHNREEISKLFGIEEMWAS